MLRSVEVRTKLRNTFVVGEEKFYLFLIIYLFIYFFNKGDFHFVWIYLNEVIHGPKKKKNYKQ